MHLWMSAHFLTSAIMRVFHIISISGLPASYCKFPNAEVSALETNILKFEKQTTRQTDSARFSDKNVKLRRGTFRLVCGLRQVIHLLWGSVSSHIK